MKPAKTTMTDSWERLNKLEAMFSLWVFVTAALIIILLVVTDINRRRIQTLENKVGQLTELVNKTHTNSDQILKNNDLIMETVLELVP